MVAEDNKKNEDFFDLIGQDQRVDDPFASDEIIFRDKEGKLKVLRNGIVADVIDSPEPEESIQYGLVKKELEEAKKELELPMGTGTIMPPPKIDIDKEVDHVINDAGIKFNDKEIEKRFRNIVRSGLKKVRNLVQTKEAFLSPMTAGGMGFDPQAADRVIGIIRNHSKHLEEKVFKESYDTFSELQSEMSQLLKKGQVAASADSEQLKEESRPVPDFAPFFQSDKSLIEKVKEKDQEQLQVQEEESSVIAPAAPPTVEQEPEKSFSPTPIMERPIVSDIPNKPKIEDIRFQPKLTGPIEEIRSMTLVDFRRLATDPRQAIEKIIAKINLLEEESFTKKTQAVKAWKESAVNRMYMDLGDQSMEKGKSISEIINAKTAAGEETLTNNEVEAIIELNQRLRY